MNAVWRFDPRGFVLPIGLIAFAEIYAYATNLQSDALAPPSDILVSGLAARTRQRLTHRVECDRARGREERVPCRLHPAEPRRTPP